MMIGPSEESNGPCIGSTPQIPLMKVQQRTNNLFMVNNNDLNITNNINDLLKSASQTLTLNNLTSDGNLSSSTVGSIMEGPPLNDAPRALLSCNGNSHPFDARTLDLSSPVKVGRAVARVKATQTNAIFDCKVLSRNHAVLWFEDGIFYLRDTKSSNGTFVNRERLSENGNESAAAAIYSGDILQFGVDVVENTKKVTHGCIIGTIRLFLPGGQEVHPSPNVVHSKMRVSGSLGSMGSFPNQPVAITTYQLVQISQCLKEAMSREELLEKKINSLEDILSSVTSKSQDGWKALLDEDRLLSRIESLQARLETALTCLNSKSAEEEVAFLREQVMKLHEEKDAHESLAKEIIQRTTSKLQVAESLSTRLEQEVQTSQAEVLRLTDVLDDWQKQVDQLSDKFDKKTEEFTEMACLHASCEEKLKSLTEQLDLLKSSMTTMVNSTIVKSVTTTTASQVDSEQPAKNGRSSPSSSSSSSPESSPESKKIKEENEDKCDDMKSPVNGPSVTMETEVGDEAKPEIEEDTEKNLLKAQITQLSYGPTGLRVMEESVNRLKMEAAGYQAQIGLLLEKSSSASKEVECLSKKLSDSEKKMELVTSGHSDQMKELEAQLTLRSLEVEGLRSEVKNLKEYSSRLERQTEELVKNSTSSGNFVQSPPPTRPPRAISPRLAQSSPTSESPSTTSLESLKAILSTRDIELQQKLDEIELLTKQLRESSEEKESLQESLTSVKEDLEVVKYQSKITSTCAILPLLMLLIAFLMAFYPTVSTVTGTAES